MIKSTETNNYTFNFNEFKKFKIKINIYLENKYNKTITQIFKDKKIKEAVYKYILGFEGNTDIFKSGRNYNIQDFNLPKNINEIINELKEHSKEILYKD